jgi:hypothetical protein
MDWIHAGRPPITDDIREYQVWLGDQVRRVRRIGNRSMSLTPGTLVFTDCRHPMDQAICHEPRIMAWRLASPPVGG